MITTLINSDNWTFCHYASANLKAIISFGASPESTSDELEYYVTVIDEEGKDVFQKDFNSLDSACSYINNRYQKIWKFVDATVKTVDASGCSTCVAH